MADKSDNSFKTAMSDAANDPLFLTDIKEIENDFKYADVETNYKKS